MKNDKKSSTSVYNHVMKGRSKAEAKTKLTQMFLDGEIDLHVFDMVGTRIQQTRNNDITIW